MSGPRLTTAQKAEIVRMYKRGEKISVIAAAFDVAYSYPGLLAKRRNAQLRMPTTCRDNMSRKALARSA